MEKFNRALILILTVTLSLIFRPAIAMAGSDDSGNDTFYIATVDNDEKFSIGKEIKVYLPESENEEDYTFCWKIDDNQVSANNSYTPTYEDLEKYINVSVNGPKITKELSIYFSKLPVIYINTDDGKSITSNSEYKSGTIHIQGNTDFDTQYDGTMEIKGRGNSTWKRPKKPYKIKLSEKTDLFGFGKNKHWVLLANYLDESLLRNTIAKDLAKELGMESYMQTTFADVILNGQYIGNYQLCEQIRVADDDTRVNIQNFEDIAGDVAKACYKKNKTVLTKEDQSAIEELLISDYQWISSKYFTYNGQKYYLKDFYTDDIDILNGYLFELSEEYDEQSKFTTDGGLMVMVNTPETTNTNAVMTRYVKERWNDFEEAIKSPTGYNSKGQHYSELVDMDSLVEFWLTNEILGNDDGVKKSRYAYIGDNNKITFGPVWDFDWGVGSSPVGNLPTGWKITGFDNKSDFFKELIDDPYFTLKAREKYINVRQYLSTFVEDGGVLDTYDAYIHESALANSSLWKSYVGYEDDFATLKDYLSNRFVWLDAQFKSNDSLMESLKNQYSANSYTKSDSLEIDIDGESNLDAGIAEYNLQSENKLNFALKTSQSDASKAMVYDNGILLESCDLENGQCNITRTLYGNSNDSHVINVQIVNGSGDLLEQKYFVVKLVSDLACSHDSEIVESSDATADTAGYQVEKCKLCGTESVKFINPLIITHSLTHTFSESVTAATCSSGGYTTFVCNDCGLTYVDGYVDILGHTTTEVKNEKAATCGKAGYTGDTYCSVCGELLKKGKTIPATGKHTWNAGTIKKDSTISAKGIRIYTCTVCKTTKTESIAKKKKGEVITTSDSKGIYKVNGDGGVKYVSPKSSKYKNVEIPDTVKDINGKKIKVTAVAAGAFKDNKTVKTIKVGSSVTWIGNNAFKGCTKLSELTISNKKLKKENLCSNTFSGISSKTKINVPNSKASSYKKLFIKMGLNKKCSVK